MVVASSWILQVSLILGIHSSCVVQATLFCTKYMLVIPIHLQQILIKKYSVNVRFYFQSPDLDVGPICSSSHTDLHRVAASHTESSPTNFDQF